MVTSALFFFPLRQSSSNVNTDHCSSYPFCCCTLKSPSIILQAPAFQGDGPTEKQESLIGWQEILFLHGVQIKNKKGRYAQDLRAKIKPLYSPLLLLLLSIWRKQRCVPRRRLLVLAVLGGFCPAAVIIA